MWARRKIPRVDGLFQVFIGIIVEELADHRIRIKDGILVLSVNLFHPPDVHVLNGMPVLSHLERPADGIGDFNGRIGYPW